MRKSILFVMSVFAVLVLAACARQEAMKAPESMAQPVLDAEKPVEAMVVEKATPAAPTQPAETMTKPADETNSAVSTKTVSIKGFKFVPSEITVNVGDTIVWTNDESATHTVESADGIITSDELFKGDSFSMTFSKPGTHAYICGIHPSMKGTVIVVE